MRRYPSYLFSILCTAAMLCGCTDNSFSGLDQEWNGDVETAIPIMAAVSNVDGGLAKGSGVVEDLGGLMDKTITVFAARRDAGVKYTDRQGVLLAGEKARLNKSDFYLHWEGPMNYYPNRDRYMETYDFFAYCTDDAKVAGGTVSPDKAVLSVVVDGSQDIMLSKAGSPTTDPRILENLFSYYTARSNIIPIFHFKHAMSCMDFKVIPGVSGESMFKITVQSVSILSADNLDFVYAAKDSSSLGVHIPETAGQKLLPLHDPKGGPFPENTYTVVTRQKSSDQYEPLPLKGVLITPPVNDNTSALVLDVEETRLNPETLTAEGKPVRQTVTILINHTGGMSAGHHYSVSLTLSGNMTVSASVSLSPWSDAGTMEFGQDEKPI